MYWVPADRFAVGSRVAFRAAPSYVTFAPTLVLPALSVNDVPLTPVTASENVAVTLSPTATAVALTAGVRADTVGVVAPAQVEGLVTLLPLGS